MLWYPRTQFNLVLSYTLKKIMHYIKWVIITNMEIVQWIKCSILFQTKSRRMTLMILKQHTARMIHPLWSKTSGHWSSCQSDHHREFNPVSCSGIEKAQISQHFKCFKLPAQLTELISQGQLQLAAVSCYSGDTLPPICFEHEFDSWTILTYYTFKMLTNKSGIFSLLQV